MSARLCLRMLVCSWDLAPLHTEAFAQAWLKSDQTTPLLSHSIGGPTVFHFEGLPLFALDFLHLESFLPSRTLLSRVPRNHSSNWDGGARKMHRGIILQELCLPWLYCVGYQCTRGKFAAFKEVDMCQGTARVTGSPGHIWNRQETLIFEFDGRIPIHGAKRGE